MTAIAILPLLLQDDGRTINEIALETGEDTRALRLALLAATAEGWVAPDEAFLRWQLTDAGRRLVSRPCEA
jgi:DNA-binding IclR family transcriptional regulator